MRGPKPPFNNPSGLPPPLMDSLIPEAQQQSIVLTLGSFSSSNGSIGGFTVWLLNGAGHAPAGAEGFGYTAIGKLPPTNDANNISSYNGFKGMTVNMVFPQFVTCAPNMTALTVSKWITANSIDPVRCDWSKSDANYQLNPSQTGYGIVSQVKANKFYYIRKAESEVKEVNSRDIGLISAADMTFLDSCVKFLCSDYETYYPSTTSSSSSSVRRVKRSGDDYGFTSCSMK